MNTYTLVHERLSANDRLSENCVAQHPKPDNEVKNYMLYDYIHKCV